MTLFGTLRPFSSLALFSMAVLVLSGCGKGGMSSQKVSADGLTGAANPEGLAYTAFGPPKDLQEAATDISPEAQRTSLSPEGIRWISLKQNNDSQKMELTVRYRNVDGRVTPVRFEGAVLPSGQGKRAVLRPVLPPTSPPDTNQTASNSPSSSASQETAPPVTALPDVSSLEVECSDLTCSKANVNFMNEQDQKIAAAIVREQVVQADAQFVGENAPLSDPSGPPQDQATVPLRTSSVEVVGGRTVVQVREQGASQSLLVSGEIVQTNGGAVQLRTHRPGLRAELVGNSQEGDIVIAFERVESTPPVQPDVQKPSEGARQLTLPPLPNNPPSTTPPISETPTPAPSRATTTTRVESNIPVLPGPRQGSALGGRATAPVFRSSNSPTSELQSPRAGTPPGTPEPPTDAPQQARRTYVTIGSNQPTVGGLPRFELCPVVPLGESNAAKAIRESCEHTFWTNRPEYKMTEDEQAEAERNWEKRGKNSRTKPELGAKYFYLGHGEPRAFAKFLNLFTGQSTDEKQTPFNRLVQLIRQSGLSLAWSFVPYVESKFEIEKKVVSERGAAGPFQFMPNTGREYGLSPEDRFNFDLAAPAAVRFFSVLNRHQERDFLLAVASYNAGQGGIDSAERATAEAMLKTAREDLTEMNKHVGAYTSDWWKILYFNMAPKQTQHYVVRIVTGAIYGLNPEKYGIQAKALKPDAL